MTDNVDHVGGYTLALEGIDETQTECCSLGAKDPGGFGTEIIWEVMGLVV